MYHTAAMRGNDDLIPVRDSTFNPPAKKTAKVDDGEGVARQAAQQRHMVGRWTREDLEDKYFRIYEENILLKKHARRQEEKIKRMATKLLRLVSDKKKTDHSQGVTKTRDIETEEMLEELHTKVRDFEKQNHQLREKLMVAKQQISAQATRKTQYGHVQSRIDTGVSKPAPDPRIMRNMRVSGPPPSNRNVHSPVNMPRYGHSILEETRAENRHLENEIARLNEQINFYEQDVDMFKEQMRIREIEYEEDLQKVKQQMTLDQRAVVQENIDIIKLQREVKEKSTQLMQLQAQFTNMDDRLRATNASHEQVLSEMEILNQQLKHEQCKNLGLQNELKQGSTSKRALLELEERVVDLQKECDILKDANEKLVTSAFDLEREREWRQRETALKVQIAQLEATLKADVGEKGNILDKWNDERDTHEKLAAEHKDMRRQFYEIKQENDELKDKMRFFTAESAVDFQEIEEALMIVKKRKEKGNQELEFLHKVDEEQTKDYEKLIREMRAEHADTINELEKTRNMLIVQHKINKDYQTEVESVSKKMEDDKADYDSRLEEMAHLLDIRAKRIRKLEGQLRDVAYGTRQYRLQTEDEEGSDVEEFDETLQLERGQNMFEIHVKQVTLSPEAVRLLGDDEPAIFCTWEFYEFEIQSTPVMKGPKSEFEFTSQYLVRVDDFFLHYLQKDSCTVELHQSFGTNYKTLAASQFKMRDILDRSSGRMYGSVQLIGVDSDGTGINYGTLEYWVRLKVPMEQALRLYKERSKALGYLESNLRGNETELAVMDPNAARRPDNNINELHIKISRCQDLKSRREDMQPSPYCIYKFFDYPEHDTVIIPGSNNPHFSDQKAFPVPMTADLDKYLKSQKLEIYVFDDTDPEEATYIGLAKVPLLPLAHDKSIKGTFELSAMDGTISGSMNVNLKWAYSYLPPRAGTRTVAQRHIAGSDDSKGLALMPGEEDALQNSTFVAGAPDTGPPLSRARKSRGPAAESTPMHKVHPSERTDDLSASYVESGLRHGKPSYQNMDDIREDTEPEGSVVSEGTPVSGESEPVSDESSDEITPRVPPVEATPLPPESDMETTVTPTTDGEKTSDEIQTEDLPQELQFENGNKEKDEYERENYSDIEELTPKEDFPDNQVDDGDSIAETESSDVVMPSPSSRPQSRSSQIGAGDSVTLIIHSLSLDEESPIVLNEAVQKLYVEYRFLGIPLQDTETPYSLAKPSPNKHISFNFARTFSVDIDNYYERRQLLASMLLPDDPDSGRMPFTVVSEPENADGDCEDVGVAYVSVPDILETEKDLVERDIPIYDVEDESRQVGTLNVTVKCLDALLAVRLEMATADD